VPRAEANRIDALVAAELGLQSQLNVRALAEEWYSVQSRSKTGKWGSSGRHADDTRGYLDSVILPGIGDVPLDALRRADVRALLDGVDKDSVERKVRNAAGAMLAWGYEEQWLTVGRDALMPPAAPQRRRGRP